eukprot:SAG31_NODE_22407_length_526_cov_1.039813_1_plen_101_part_00
MQNVDAGAAGGCWIVCLAGKNTVHHTEQVKRTNFAEHTMCIDRRNICTIYIIYPHTIDKYLMLEIFAQPMSCRQTNTHASATHAGRNEPGRASAAMHDCC